ncbi:MAG: dynamin family protein [Myxococcota bacterium]
MKLFVSYARSDRSDVIRLVMTLRTRFDVQVRCDVDLEPGSGWSGNLNDWLVASDVVLLWATTASRTAKGVADELDLAQKHGRHIVPVMVGAGVVQGWGAPVSGRQGIPIAEGASPEEIAAFIGAHLGLSVYPTPDRLEAALIEAADLVLKAAVVNAGLMPLHGKVLEELWHWRSRRFKVAVVALVKAGKSTTVNAWLGQEFLPMANVAETARVVRITHEHYDQVGVLIGDERTWRGAEEISEAIKRMNRESRATLAAPTDLHLQVHVAAFGGRGDEQRSRGAGIELIDTPGPNEAGADHLRARTEAIVTDADAIVYVLDYTRLNTTDEARFLESVSALREDMLSAWTERLFFLVNKIDDRDRHDQSAEDAQAYVTGVLRKYLKIDVSPERVCPVSARMALLARLCLGDHLSPAARKDMAQRVAGMRWAQVSDADLRSAAPELLIESGFPAAEDAILGFLGSRAERLLRQSVVDRTERTLAEVDKHLRLQKELTVREREELSAQVRRLQEKLGRAKGRFRELEEIGKRQQEAITTRTKTAFDVFRARLDRQVDALGGDVAPGLMTGAFQRARDAVQATANRYFGPDEDARATLLLTLDTVLQWAGDEYARFRVDLERDVHEHQRRLIEELRTTCAALAREVDRNVSETLNLTISPVDLEIPEATRLGLHEGIEGELGVIMAEAVRRQRRRVQEQVRSEGFCGTPVWRTQWVERYEDIRVRRMEVYLVRHFLREQFEQAFTTSQQTASALTGHMVTHHVRSAEGALDAYVERYRATLQIQIERATRDAEAREQADAVLEGCIANVGAIRSALRSAASGAPPEGQQR